MRRSICLQILETRHLPTFPFRGFYLKKYDRVFFHDVCISENDFHSVIFSPLGTTGGKERVPAMNECLTACLLQKQKITAGIRNKDLQNSRSGDPGDDSHKDSDLHTLPFLSFAASNPSQSPSSPLRGLPLQTWYQKVARNPYHFLHN